MGWHARAPWRVARVPITRSSSSAGERAAASRARPRGTACASTRTASSRGRVGGSETRDSRRARARRTSPRGRRTALGSNDALRPNETPGGGGGGGRARGRTAARARSRRREWKRSALTRGDAVKRRRAFSKTPPVRIQNASPPFFGAAPRREPMTRNARVDPSRALRVPLPSRPTPPTPPSPLRVAMDEIPEDADVVTASETGAFPLGVIVAHVASMLAWCAFGVYDARRARRADPAPADADAVGASSGACGVTRCVARAIDGRARGAGGDRGRRPRGRVARTPRAFQPEDPNGRRRRPAPAGNTRSSLGPFFPSRSRRRPFDAPPP